MSGELHRSFRISSNFKAEKDRIYKKFRNAGYPSRFINSVMNNFRNNNISNDDVIIPKWLFEEKKREIFINIPHCQENEKEMFHIITPMIPCFIFPFQLYIYVCKILAIFNTMLTFTDDVSVTYEKLQKIKSF